MDTIQREEFFPCCGRHCALAEPGCGRGEEYRRTGVIPERGPHGGHHGGGRPRKSVLDSEHFAEMSQDEKLAALFREVGNKIRHMEEKGSQNRILRILQEEGIVTQRALTERMGVQPGSASELLGKLERVGFIARTANETDRRTVDVFLTEAGKQQAEQLQQEGQARASAMFSTLSEAEKETLRSAMESLLREWQRRRAQGCSRES